jgi:hypothetical protein
MVGGLNDWPTPTLIVVGEKIYPADNVPACRQDQPLVVVLSMQGLSARAGQASSASTANMAGSFIILVFMIAKSFNWI